MKIQQLQHHMAPPHFPEQGFIECLFMFILEDTAPTIFPGHDTEEQDMYRCDSRLKAGHGGSYSADRLRFGSTWNPAKTLDLRRFADSTWEERPCMER